MAPWVHTHIWPNGDVYPCCMVPGEFPVANYKELGDLKLAWNSEKYKDLRVNMLNDVKSSACTRCYTQEKHGKHSLRKRLSKEYANQYDLVGETEKDGHLEKLDLRYLDIRFSNICNFTCRTCGPELSSSWAAHRASKYPESKLPTIIRIESSSKNKEFWDDLSQYIDNVDRIYFAGGEPLLTKEHYDILDYLIEREKFNITIHYNTNFSTFDYKGRSVLDYWKKFKNIAVGASLDGSYEKGELIRKGTEWDKIVENRKLMIEECPNVRFFLAPTVSVFNADHVLDFYNEWLELGLIKEYMIQFNVLLHPECYSITLLPDEIKTPIVEKIDDLLQQSNDIQNNGIVNSFRTDIQHFRSALLDKIDDNTKESLLIELNRRINELDAERNESTWAVFPNLISMRR
jgi:radical SAM protein with 4Fe4S-binding SPASM domain